jgi:hypothetical protein
MSLVNFEQRRIQRGDWVKFRLLPKDCDPVPRLVTAVSVITGMVRLLDGEGWYAPHLLKVSPPPTTTQIVKRLKARGAA